MKTFNFLAAFLLMILHASSQEKTPASHFLGVGLAKSKHGLGDVSGLAFNTELSWRQHKSIYWTATVGGSIHDGEKALLYTAPAGNTVDGSIRHTTAGVQASWGPGYQFFKHTRHEAGLNLGVLLRYQSTSYFDVVTILYPPITGLPIPVVYFENLTPARSFALGGKGGISYSFITRRNLVFRLSGEFQIDTNGDVLSQTGLTFGKRF
jgi:hypothetical protein